MFEHFALADGVLGRGKPCVIVGEVGQAHEGSLGMAHAFIDAIANAGADAVKFQTHIASAESTSGEPWRIKFSRQDNTRYDYWKRMEFSEGQWDGLKHHAETARPVENVRTLKALGSALKIPAVQVA